jgi:iron complex outermembrane recepter protein
MTQPSLTKDSTYARSEASFTRGGEPSYEAGIAHGGPLIENVLGYRASIWYRYDGGWIDRIDPTTLAVVDRHANRANTVAARLALVLQPAEGVTITPAVMYQNSRKHDESTYWPAYSNVDSGHFLNATPERLPVPDEYYLPSLKIEVDIGRTKLISNTSYYNRDELTAYQGSSYDLAYFQSLGWPASGFGGVDANNNPLPLGCGSAATSPVPDPVKGCSWYPLLDGKGVHLPAGFAGYSTPNLMTNQQQTVTQEIRLQSNDDSSRWKWTLGAFWSLSKEVSIEELKDPQINQFFTALYGQDAITTFGPYYFCNGVGTPQTFPDCDIYYNKNTSHDRQLAGFGEVTYGVTDRLKLTVGGRFAKMAFDLAHYADGLENFGPATRSGDYHESAFTPKFGASFQLDPQNLFYFTYAKGFRPGGVNPELPPVCGPGLIAEGYPDGQSPLKYKSDTTQSYEIGSKNNFNNRVRLAASVYYVRWQEIQQNVYVAANCGFQFTDNLGTAVAKGFDLQAQIVLGGGFSLDASVGYTSARYTKDSLGARAKTGDAISGEAAINYSPGTNAPWNVALGPQYNFAVAGHDAFVRLDWEYASRNPWLAAVQDPLSSQYNANSYTLGLTSFASLRAGVTLGSWAVSAFVDNLFDTRTTLNYAQVQVDANNPSFNPLVPTSVQENRFTFRPRTVGITATYRL